MIKITLPDGSVKEFEKGVSALDVVKSISEGLARNAVCVKVNDELMDLNCLIENDCNFKVLTFKDEEGKDVYRHTTSHILAQAIKNVYPTAKLAIGPSVKNGFYYDIDFKTPITLEDFPAIEAEMQKIIKADLPITRSVMTTKQAAKVFADEPYKKELIEGITDKTVSVYTQGNFSDMCRGPHLLSTGRVKAFKLTQIAGAYWRGDSKNKMLTRIYGTSFDKKSDLDEYLAKVEDAKKRDHNKLGRELGLFMTDELVGQGLPLLMPKGARILKTLIRWVEDEEERRGYQFVRTPIMAKSDLYKVSGHWDHYRDGMFILGDPDKSDTEEVLALRPMDCPFQFEIYKNGVKSYKDLPVRYNETAPLFRNENSGEMHGLIRVRQFTLADGHIICRPDQVEQEFLGVLDLIIYLMTNLGLEKDVSYRFSRWDPNNTDKYIDDPDAWTHAESKMKEILDKADINYVEAIGEAAFYGPKLDVQCVNVFGKEDTLFTIQIDFELS
ncbi:MAG: threonine--tRNA ligase, partial [Eubacteriales bacterium]|nr:threonine--tRNA ligase [Eubacteriales bacterium]